MHPGIDRRPALDDRCRREVPLATMLDAFRLAIADALAPEQRRAVIISALAALLLLLALWLGAAAFLEQARVAGIWWFDRAITVVGALGAAALCWLVFPSVTLVVLGFFLDRVLTRLENRHYPGLPPPRRGSVGESLASALRIFLLSLVLNVIALPFYVVVPINFFVYYGLNGYLVGREYFELVALRRMDGAAARAMWRWHRGKLILAGVVIVFLLSLPLINLVAPVIAAAFLLHVVEGLRRSATS